MENKNICFKDFSTVCRICLHFGDLTPFKDLDLYGVFQSIMLDDIQTELELEDKLPKNICRTCAKDLESISKFISKYKSSINILKTIIRKANQIVSKDYDQACNNADNFAVTVLKDACIKFENDCNTEAVKEEAEMKTEVLGICNSNLSKNNNEHCEPHFNYTYYVSEPSVKCRICKKLLPGRSALLEHCLSVHKFSEHTEKQLSHSTQKKLIVDNICEDSFVEIKLENDKKSDIKRTTYVCKICGKNYKVLKKLLAHINVHTSLKPYKCDSCGKQFTHRNSWRYHVSTHIYEKLFNCIFCNWRGVSKNSLVTHIEELHKQTKVTPLTEDKNDVKIKKKVEKKQQFFLCNICGKNFTRRNTLNTHFKIHNGEKNFVCNICGFRFVLKCTLNRHLAVHKGEKEFVCSICGKRLSQKRYLKKHIEAFHGTEKGISPKKERIPSYFCSNCGRGFIFKKSLKRHEITHKTGEDINRSYNKNEIRDFLCTECGKQFAFKCNMDRHILITHSGEKPFECNVCGDRFTAKNSLDYHLNIHNDLKPYQCTYCQKSFRQPSSLRKHLLVHTGERRFKCHICEMAFKTSSHLKTHFKRHSKS